VNRGALVVSLDFELLWGVRDALSPGNQIYQSVVHAKEAGLAILECLEQFSVGATWATVGLLFATDRTMQEEFWPNPKASYTNQKLAPEHEVVGANEIESPLHFGLSLLRAISASGLQEVASHTYTHFYCQEDGQTLEQFDSDLSAAQAIAKKNGFKLNSLVLPRNQVNVEYLEVLIKNGFNCYRGNERNWGSLSLNNKLSRIAQRAFRLADSCINLSGHNLLYWDEIRERDLANVRASRFLRPHQQMGIFNGLQLKRIKKAMRRAARNEQIFHLWWHPHNFGLNLESNIQNLRSILCEFKVLQAHFGMEALTMGEVAKRVGAFTSPL
jgi:hypothetical protein